MRNYKGNGDRMDYQNSGSAISAGGVVVLSNRIGVAKDDIATGGEGPVVLDGAFELAAETGVAFNQGDKLYWNTGSAHLTKTATGNTAAGIALEPKTNGAALAQVRLEVLSSAAGGGTSLDNDEYLVGRNAADDGDVDLIKADASNRIQIAQSGNGVTQTVLIASPGGYEGIRYQGTGTPANDNITMGAGGGAGYLDLGFLTLYLVGQVGVDPANLVFFDLDNSNFVTLKAPNAISSDYTLKLPTAGPSAAGVMGVAANGQMSCVAGASGTFTSQDGKTITVTNGVITSIV
jgi:predicted RecA/RadA family phage recombinase